jgi:hypothetical protein
MSGGIFDSDLLVNQLSVPTRRTSIKVWRLFREESGGSAGILPGPSFLFFLGIYVVAYPLRQCNIGKKGRIS